ncbi:WD repeat-containing protein 74 [Caligus rogercresseyi]|uniref:WD repeat-containing protein 74 n=1 Tax=Caligus rogercresseyi TaxID=217165 RepID=A0A7T8GQH0_CALRO|nr:WD repeat-containing protein 74 [Caligus rogercresseyi]
MDSKKKRSHNVYVGAESGLLKGVSINPKENRYKNFHRLKSLSKEHEITALTWVSEGEILFGTRGQRVSGFDPSDDSFSSGRHAEEGSGAPIVGLGRLPDETLVTAYGTLNNPDVDSQTAEATIGSLKKGKNLRVAKLNGNLLASGGQEHDLHITDLEAGAVTFRAKNVPPDSLQLRVPVWVSDLLFLEEERILSYVSRHSHIRLYDVRAQRRPLVSFGYPNKEPLTCMARTHDSKGVLVGSSQGGLAHFDLRMGLKGMVKKYKGSVGSIRSIAYENGHFAAVGLDRFIRIYSLEKRIKQSRLYLKSRLNHVVLRKGFDPDFEEDLTEESEVVILEDDEEIIWSDMETVDEEPVPSKKKKKNKSTC